MIIPPLPVIVRALMLWLILVAAESVHGALRRLFLEPIVGDFTARQLAVLTGAVLAWVLTLIFVGWIRARRPAHLVMIGVGWAVLTLAFEVGLGRALGFSWDRLAADYDLTHGGFMPIGLLAIALSPVTAWWLRAAHARRRLLKSSGGARQDWPTP